MIESIYQENKELLDSFASDNWNKLKDVKSIERILNELVKILLERFDIETDVNPLVIISQFSKPNFKGQFNHNTQQIEVSHDLFVNKLKQPYYNNGVPLDNVLSNKESFDTLMHEFRHLWQRLSVINSNRQLNENELLLFYNHEHRQHKSLNAYFINRGDDESAILYNIQPLERDAFIFADTMTALFNDNMQKYYPEDPTFERNYPFSKLQHYTQLAKEFFQTKTPYEDIDDIIRHINGVKPLKPLNQLMLSAVEKTQEKTLAQKFLDKFSCEEELMFNDIECDEIELG